MWLNIILILGPIYYFEYYLNSILQMIYTLYTEHIAYFMFNDYYKTKMMTIYIPIQIDRNDVFNCLGHSHIVYT